MGSAAKKFATYEDVLNAPEHKVAEVLDGELHLSPRPAARHSAASSSLGEMLGGPFKRGRGGPGGWLILDEPEVHLDRDILVPDLAGWRRERLPSVGSEAYFTIAPDWICEVLSPSTEKIDRAKKLRIYAREGVRYAWLVETSKRTVEVMRLEGENWLLIAVYEDDAKIRAEPFDAIELDLADLWADLDPIEK